MPIPIEQRIIAIIFSIVLLLVIIQLIRKHKLREEYALIWLAASLSILFLSIFGGLTNLLATLFAVSYAPTLILVSGLLFALVVLLSQSVALSAQSNRVRDLAQSVALLEWQLRQLAKGASNSTSPEPATTSEDGRSVTTDAPGTASTAAELVTSQETRPGKMLVVGLDGATFDLIKPWAAEGYLPTLGRLMREGAHGMLRSTVPPMTAPAWTSFATGTNPGKHRLYDWIAREPESYHFSPVTALNGTAPTLYRLLSQANRRVCTLNVPMTYPPVPVNGVMVSGLPAPSTQSTITYPTGLYQDILQAVGDYILYPDPGQAYSEAGVQPFLERLYRCTEIRVRTFDYLRQQDDWDFAMIVFNGTDTICHALWKYTDPKHPVHDPGRHARFSTAIRDYYQYMDNQLARILDTVDDDTTLIIMSDHGSGPFHKFIHVNNWLIQEGFMHIRSGLGSRLKQRLFSVGFAPMNVYNMLMRMGLGGLKREVVRGQGQGLLKALFLSFADVDWRRTVAYSLGNVGQIYLNVAGREPSGRVQPGTEYEGVRDHIIARLQELRDPETGERVVEAIYRREEIYTGDQLQHAPDILFIPRRMEYFGFGEYEFGSHRVIEAVERGISGTHRLNGVFLAYGRGVQPGIEVKDAQLVDLAPTILHMMGVPVPEHMDGRVLQEILSDTFQPATLTSSNSNWQNLSVGDSDGLTEEEQRALTERLRGLGYVG
jgi:predicted AlkP superfamily phosphohydrolase/phosphomutase